MKCLCFFKLQMPQMTNAICILILLVEIIFDAHYTFICVEYFIQFSKVKGFLRP